MKRSVQALFVAVGLVVVFATASLAAETPSAGSKELQISEILDEKTYLMNDGSMWSLDLSNQLARTSAGISTVTGDRFGGLGITQDGKLVEWSYLQMPEMAEGQASVKQTAAPYWLKADGSVWTGSGKVEGLTDIRLIGYGDTRAGALSEQGEVLLQDAYQLGAFRKLGDISDVSAVKQLAVYDNRVALLYNSGEVVVYEETNFDDSGRIIPVTVAEDAVHIAYTAGDPTPALVVTRQDGTVWLTGNYQQRWELESRAAGLNDIAKTSGHRDGKNFFAQRKDGSWVSYDNGKAEDFNVPKASELAVSLSSELPLVGETIHLYLQETYTNGAKLKLPAADADIAVQKPSLLKLQPDGSLKATGVGETEVQVSSGGITKTVAVSISLSTPLKYAKLVDGSTYVPARAVIEAFGGTLTVVNGTMQAQVGGQSLSFKAGDVNATLNGEPLQLKSAPIIDQGTTLMPSYLLRDVLGAGLLWDSRWQQLVVTAGSARMTIVSAETAGLIKREQQGELAQFIGKTYWVNGFQGWERFSKVTVSDILPTDTGFFLIQFTAASGEVLESYTMPASKVKELFTEGIAFLDYNPYSKYNWPSAVWESVKAGQATIGMSKEQVQFAWGTPSHRSTTSVNGDIVETWVYGNYDAVSFINGKAAFVID